MRHVIGVYFASTVKEGILNLFTTFASELYIVEFFMWSISCCMDQVKPQTKVENNGTVVHICWDLIFAVRKLIGQQTTARQNDIKKRKTNQRCHRYFTGF